ncbi:MAG: immune inhibitor A [Ignavibacteriales bacterium]|nr:immune inhibitor A [Ignavibacteriales bacterium]
MKKAIILLTLLIIIISNLYSSDLYKRVKVFIPDESLFRKLLSTGIDMEGAVGKIGGWVEVTLSDEELDNIKNLGFQTQILVEDLTKYFSKRLVRTPFNALGFGNGSMGGNYTFDEVVQQLDSMRNLYPNLITAKFSIGNTLQGRSMWAVRIAKDADVPSTKPEVLYTALTHAREPQGMMNLIYFMWHLLNNYGTDPEATYLVDNRQLYFVPVINADGYEANRRISPTGGGMRRKNMRNVVVDNDSYGVDLNRNYGYKWGLDDAGSSPYSTSETYRGTSAFSEPEIFNIALFCIEHNFKTAFNFHSYGNLLLYPWDHTSLNESPDSVQFAEYGQDMVKYNYYFSGPSGKSLYLVNGGATDWMYGDQDSKNKIFSFLPEVGNGSDYFWPSSDRILPIAQENLYPNLYLANVAGSYPRIQGFTITDSNDDGDLEKGESFLLNLSIRNKGLDSTKNLFLEISASSPIIKTGSDIYSLGKISPTTNYSVSLPCTVSAYAPNGPQYLYVKIKEDPDRYLYDTIKLTIGKYSLAFSDSAENGTGNWNTGIGWGLSTTSHSPSNSFTDSPSGNYADITDNSLMLASAINLSGAEKISLRFWGRWELEPSWDFVTVEASSDGGVTWGTVQGKYNKPGSGIGVQTTGTYGYDGFQNEWIEDDLDFSSYISSNFKIRFRLMSDEYTNYDGFYVDDIRLFIIEKDTTLRTILVTLNDKWNLVSIPIDTPFVLKTSFFLNSISSAFEYTGNAYSQIDTLKNGEGYWLKFDSSQILQMQGRSYSSGSFNVIKGWNLIGSISTPVLTSFVTSDPPGIVTGNFFGYNNNYSITDTIQPGYGYWVKTDESGTLYLSTAQSANLSSRIKIINTNDFPPAPPDINIVEKLVPSDFKLYDAYPNPFNPKTKIKFNIAKPSNVLLKVYDLYGREVASLVNERKDAGEYSVQLDAEDLSSGIYFCKMTVSETNAGNNKIYSESKKIILMK